MYFHINVVEAENVPSFDLMSESDPMCGLVMSSSPAREQTTATIQDCNNPFWNETFRFRVVDPEVDVLTVSLYDSDSFSHREFISKVELKVDDFIEGKVIDKWYELPTTKSNKVTRIKLICQLAVNGRIPFIPY